MIEGLVSPRAARENPGWVFFLAILFVSLAVVVAIALPSLDGAAITFAFAPAIPLIWSLIVREEEVENSRLPLLEQKRAWEYHLPLVKVFALFFLGASIAYLAWYVILPQDISHKVFAPQVDEIERIGIEFNKSPVSTAGDQGVTVVRTVSATGNAIKPDLAWRLFSHNVVVLSFMFIFSLVYGIGAIYLLLWNASIIGIFVGERLRQLGVGGFLQALLGIIPHGVLEIGAYFLAAIAGGILSAALMHQHHRRPQFKYILVDVALLSFVSIAALALAAVLESTL
ncbi:stage II sporulation protein M [Candidatus Micrarchaeota archaeon]|nr:stage II sporulation protein M [Candidatus Micrarchaeota archaeon]